MQQKKIKNKILSSLLLILGLGAIGYVSVAMIGERQRISAIDVMIDEKKTEATALKDNIKQLNKENVALASDAVKEANARKLGYAEKGVVEVFISDDSQENIIPTEISTLSDDSALWQKWIRIFFSK